MILKIENKTPYLNNYHFQTLCLLYYPGEKFPTGISSSENAAEFYIEERVLDGVAHIFSAVKLVSGDKNSSATECFSADSFTAPQDLAFAAQASVGSAFLKAGFALFGFLPPWGYLTGLRPVKRARYYLDRGFDEAAVSALFTKDYKVTEEKTRLSLSIASTEKRMLSKYTGNDCCLYIAIPFCPTRCEYCSFVSYSNDRLFKTIPDYLARLDADLVRTAEVIKALGFNLRAVYIGGGTPSVLNPEQLKALFSRLNQSFDLSHLNEFSFESGRPDTTTEEKLVIAKQSGVNRVSINPQTTRDDVLKRIGRAHTAEQFFRAAEIAKKVGFDYLNADLIAGLPGDDFDGFAHSLEDVIATGFNNITVHTLSVKNAAPLRFDESGIYDADGAAARRCVSYARERLEKAKLMPYYLYRQKNTIGNAENVGYAVTGTECDYNVLMMEETNTVFACGASAITKLVSPNGDIIDRIAFPKYPFEYLAAPEGIGEDRIYDFFKGVNQ